MCLFCVENIKTKRFNWFTTNDVLSYSYGNPCLEVWNNTMVN